MPVRLLHTFGSLTLTEADGTPALPESAQRRLVLLALAAEAGERGLPRDRAVAYLWPDADDEHGRRSLNQLRYMLRRELGEDPLTGTLTLRPDHTVFASDLTRFREAVSAGHVDVALSLHKGPFLDAIPLGGSSELDEWAEGTRAETRRALGKLLEQAAREAQGRADSVRAEQMWRRLVQLEPLSAPHAIGLMEALASSGDASGALVAAAEHEATVQRELGVPPDASVRAAASRIRAQTQPNAARPTPTATSRPLQVPLPAGPAPFEPGPPEPPSPPPAAPAPPPWRRRVLLAMLSVMLAAGAVAAWSARRAASHAAPASTVAVLPFTVYGGAEYEYLREGMVTLLSAKLDGEPVVRPADGHAVVSLARRDERSGSDLALAADVARQLGAGSFVVGEVVGVDGRLRLQAIAYRVGSSTPVARAGVEGPASALFTLVDSLAGSILRGLSERPGPHLLRLAEGTTTSLPALKAYLEGQQLFRSGHALAAFDAFGRAAALDTTFALANYWASVAGWWADQSDIVVTHADQALRHADRVAERDRRLLVAWDTLMRGDPTEAERIYRAVLGVEPDNVAAWSQLGEVLFHYAPRRGGSLSAARPAFERVLTYEPGQSTALLHLARVAAAEQDGNRLDSIARRFDQADSVGDWRVELDALDAAMRRDSVGLARAAAALDDAPEGRIWSLAIDVWRGTLDARVTRSLLVPLTSTTRATEARAQGHVSLAWLALAQGKLDEVRRELDRAAQLDSATALEHRALVLIMPFVPASPAELDAMRQVLARWNAPQAPRIGASHLGGVHDDAHAIIRDYLLGSLSARLGDSVEAERRATLLDRASGAEDLVRYARQAAASVRAQVAISRGRSAQASAILERSLVLETRITRAGASAFYLRGLERYLLAEQLRALRREQDAERWYRSFTSSYFDVVFQAPALVRLGELAEAHGRQGDGEYARALAIWKDADEEFAPGLATGRRAAQHRGSR